MRESMRIKENDEGKYEDMRIKENDEDKGKG